MSATTKASRSTTLDVRSLLVGLALIVSAVVLGLSWARLSAPGSSPDDDFHVASIVCPDPVRTGSCRVDTVVRPDGKTVQAVYAPQDVVNIICHVRQPKGADCLAGLNHAAYQHTDRVDLNHEYPGVYYQIAHWAYGPGNVFSGVWRVRAMNTFIAVAAFTAVALAGTAATRRLMAYSLAASLVPLGLFIIPSVNPSSWSLTGLAAASFAFYSLLHVRRGWRTWANAVLLVLGTTGAAFARTDTGPFIVALTGAILVASWKSAARHPLRLLALVPAWAVGAWSFYAGQGSRVVGNLTRLNNIPPDRVLAHNLLELPTMFFGIYGVAFNLGWFDTNVPSVTFMGASAVAIGLLAAGMRRLNPAKVAGFTLLALVHVVLPLYMLGKDYALLGEHIQPRYFLPLVPGLFLLALLGRRSSEALVLSKRATLVAQVLLAVGSAASLLYVGRRYVNGQMKEASYWFDQPSAWWWPGTFSPARWYVAGAFAGLVLSFALWAVRRRPRHRGGAHPAPDSPAA